jgi:hypothetical protein
LVWAETLAVKKENNAKPRKVVRILARVDAMDVMGRGDNTPSRRMSKKSRRCRGIGSNAGH